MNTEHPLYGFIRSAIQIATEYRDGSIDHGEMISSMESLAATLAQIHSVIQVATEYRDGVIDHGEMIASMEAALAAPPAALAHPSRGVVDEDFADRLATELESVHGWDIDPDGNGSGMVELRAALQAAALPAANVAGLREGNWHHPEGGRIVGWVIEPTDMERMKADAFCLPHEVAEALAALRDRAALPAVPSVPDDQAPRNMERGRSEAFNLADTVIEWIESGNLQAARDAIMESLVALAATPAQSAPPAVPEGYYLASFKQSGHGGEILWWGPDNRGYTPDLEQAGVYMTISPGYHDGKHTVPVPVRFIETLRVRRVVDPGDSLNRCMWNADDLRAALADFAAAPAQDGE